MRLRAFVLLFVAICVSSLCLADTVTLHYIGPNGSNAGGAYTAPYYFNINGGPQVGLMCLDFDKDSVPGTSWQATPTGVVTNQEKAAVLLFS